MVPDQAAAEWRCPGFYYSLRFFSLFEFLHDSCSAAVCCPVNHVRLLKFLRFFSLITCSFLRQVTILHYCPIFGVHYTRYQTNWLLTVYLFIIAQVELTDYPL